MAERKPLVRVDGEMKQLPDGDTIEGTGIPEAPEDGKTYGRKDGTWAEVAASASIQFPFYDASGAFDPVPLTSSNELPFFLADGSQFNIPMVTA